MQPTLPTLPDQPTLPTLPNTPDTTLPTISDIPLDMNTVSIILGALFAILVIIFLYQTKFKKKKGVDIRTPIEKMISSDIDLNTLTMIQLCMLSPPILGFCLALSFLVTNIWLSITIMGLSLLGTAAPFYWGKDKYREKKRNHFRLEGGLWKIDGTRIKFVFSNVTFGLEAVLSKEQIDIIVEQNPEWTHETLANVHIVPTKIGDEHEINLILRKPLADTFEWIETPDFDYFGTTTVKLDILELLEICRLPKVRPDPATEVESSVNEYVPTLIAMWDASRSKECKGEIMPVDITNDTVLIGLTKQIGAERRYTAGELNSKEEALRSKNKGAEQLDILAETIGISKAMEHIRNKERLTAFSFATNKFFLIAVTAIAGAILAYFFGHNAGYAAAILEFFGG
jgi:hypothetical protein